MPTRRRSKRRSGPWRRSSSDAIRGIATRCGATRSRTGCGSSAPARATSPGPESTWLSGTSAAAPADEPLWRLLGGLQQKEATYFYYLSRGDRESTRGPGRATASPRASRSSTSRSGSTTRTTLELVSTVRDALGPGPRLRLDANGSWTIPQALRNLRALARARHRLRRAARSRSSRRASSPRCGPAPTTAVCANEGLWSEAEAYARIRARDADVYCFSPYWVGSIGSFHRLSWLAHYEGLQVCKHTHGELGPRRRGEPSCRPDAAKRRRRASADRAPDGARHPHRTDPDRDAAPAGERSTDPASAWRSTRTPSQRRRRGTAAEGQYLPWQDYQLAKEER